MQKNKYFFTYKIFNLGIDPSLNNLEKFHVQAFNIILCFSFVGVFLSLATNLISLTWTSFDSILYFLGLPLMAFCLGLNYLKFTQYSKFIFIIGASILLTSMSIISGDIFVSSIINLIILGLTFNIFSSLKTIFFLAILQLTGVILSLFIIEGFTYGADRLAYDPLIRSIVYGLSFMVLLLIGYLLTRRINTAHIDNLNLISELKSRNKEIEKSYKDMEQFAYAISHDMKAPLRSINSFSQLIQKGLEGGNYKNLDKYANFVVDSGQRLSVMIDDVLTYSQLSSQEGKTREFIELSAIVEKIKYSLQGYGRPFEIKYGELGNLLGDKNQITMLFQNLIENGIKYNKSDLPIISIKRRLENDTIVFVIEDNGIGIEERHHSDIFTLFRRLHSDKEYEGTGIGLANCTRIVENHLKGRIELESEVGKGTKFLLFIPIG